MRPFSYNGILNFNRNNLRLVTGFLSGHFRLNYPLWKSNQVSSPLCRLCLEDDETTEHILCDCVVLCDSRRRVFHSEFLDSDDIRRASPISVLTFIRGVIQRLI